MKRNGMILFLVMMLVIPAFMTTLTSCAKGTKVQGGLTEEEKARLEAERLAREEAERRRLQEEGLARSAREAFEHEMVYFDFDRYNIRADAEAVLRAKADYMMSRPSLVVEVQGHCDERGTEAYNMALGDRRAMSAKNFMESLGVSGTRMTTVSYGEERPLEMGHGESSWAQNRRAQFVIIGE